MDHRVGSDFAALDEDHYVALFFFLEDLYSVVVVGVVGVVGVVVVVVAVAFILGVVIVPRGSPGRRGFMPEF